MVCMVNHATEDLQHGILLDLIMVHVEGTVSTEREEREKQNSNSNPGWRDGGNLNMTGTDNSNLFVTLIMYLAIYTFYTCTFPITAHVTVCYNSQCITDYKHFRQSIANCSGLPPNVNICLVAIDIIYADHVCKFFY